MVIGVIYKYTSPSGKVYIGQTPPKGKRRGTKTVLKLNLDGHLLEEFDSVEDAANSVGVANTNISACCRGKVKTIKGYKWRYKNGNI